MNDSQINAVKQADAILKAAGLPTHSDALSAIELLRPKRADAPPAKSESPWRLVTRSEHVGGGVWRNYLECGHNQTFTGEAGQTAKGARKRRCQACAMPGRLPK